MNLPPWRYAALMASGMTAAMVIGRWLGGAMAIGQGLGGAEHSLAEWFLQIGTHWLVIFLLGRLIAPVAQHTMRQQQRWRAERRESR